MYLALLIPAVQNKAGNILTQRLSEDIGTRVSFGNLRFYPIRRIVLNDFLVQDKQADTLLFIDQISAPIDSIALAEKKVFLGTISISRLQTDITADSTKNNFSFIVDSLFKSPPSKSKWTYQFSGIQIKESSISYSKKDAKKRASKFDPNNIAISSLNLEVNRINKSKDGLSFNIKSLSAKEKSGLCIKKTKGSIEIKNDGIYIKKFIASAQHSFISIGWLNIRNDSSLQKNDFWYKTPIDVQINSLSLDSREVSLFAPSFPKLRDRINLRGHFNGTVADLKGRSISINAGSNTEIETTFDITGLPDVTSSYLHLNVKRLVTNVHDIAKLLSLNRKSESIDLPDSFGQMGNIEYSGNFTGFIDNLVAYGRFKTKLGTINTDIGIKLTEEDKLVYSGYINTDRFNIGKILNSENNLNNVTMDVSVQGYKYGKTEFNSYIKGSIDSIDIKGYKYEKIELSGLISNKKFDGKINLNDPNAQLTFNGKVDFSKDIPEFDFDAALSNVRLDKLNFAPNLYGSRLNVMLNSNLTGNSINTVSGNTVLHNGKLWVDDKQYTLDSLIIEADQQSDQKEIVIKSDLLEGELEGKYNFNTIPSSFNHALSKYLPSLFSPKENGGGDDNFSFRIKTKKISDLAQALYSKYIISDGSEIRGSINNKSGHIQIDGIFKEIKYNSLVGKNVDIAIHNSGEQLISTINSSLVGIQNFIPLANFNITQKAFNDTIVLDLDWNDFKEHSNSGHFSSLTRIRKDKQGNLYSKINLLPSSVTVKDTLWHIQDSEINIMPSGIRVNAFRVHHLNQEININGSLYKDKRGGGALTTYFQNIDLNEATSLLNIKRLTFDGILNGSVELRDNLEQPIITSNLSLNQLKINQEDIGNMTIESNWSNLQKAVLINTRVERGNIKPLNGIGYFKPSDKDFNFNFRLDSLPLGFISLYTSKIMQNLKGTGSGNIELTKTDLGFGLNGAVKVNKAKFDVDLLQCSFFIEDSVKFSQESIYFDNMTVTDTNGKKGKLEGYIKHQNFKNMDFDMYVHANDMLLLNTKSKDNPLYYGTVYATGDMAITGGTYDLNLDISGTTQRNTKFYIPISDDEESLDNNFIRFISPDDSIKNISVSQEEEYKVDLSNFTLNMGVEVTPDAQVQVIFEPALGNILKSWGKGNLQIQINKEGEVSFLGDYMAEKGEYLFTLENVVNKRFDINKGGTVIWEGDPYDALIDITATYKLKTSLQPLTATSSNESTETSRRVPINCDLILSGRLSQPKINFDISAPTLEQDTQSRIQEVISTEEELNRQVLSLLVLNKFYTPSNNAGASENTSTNLANTYTYELLSNQLSNLVSQMINDVDVGISYRPEDEISSEQIEVALSTQIFNDRVTLNGNVEYGKYGKLNSANSNSSNIVGDFDLDVKLNKSGSLRAKAYTHSNDDFSFDNSPTTQGVGLSYQEEFDTVGELLRKYWNWITGKGKKEKEVKVEKEQ